MSEAGGAASRVISRVGIIGLGVMGAPMASNLLDAGFDVITSTHHKAAPDELVSKGLRTEDEPASVANAADAVILMLPDTQEVETVLFGPQGVVSGLGKNSLVIDMSSIAPTSTKAFAQRVRDAGCGYLDAPVSGGEVGAKNATLTIMVGGDKVAFARAHPIFEALGRNISLVGQNGDGQTAKIANQIIVATTILAVSEALLFASKSGADPEQVRTALLGGFANSKILEMHGRRMVERTFEPGFRIRLHQKDLDLALSSAKENSIPLPATALCQQLFNVCAAHDLGDKDHAALVQSLEVLADHNLA